MRISLLILAPVLLLVAAFALTRYDEPEPQPTYQPAGDPVLLDFEVTKFTLEEIEIALQNPREGELFMQFDIGMSNARPVATLKGISEQSQASGERLAPLPPDFTFLKGPNDERILNFGFMNQIGRDDDKNPALRMTYMGLPVPLVRQLTILEDIKLPAFLSERLQIQGQIALKKGSYRLNRKIQGFWVPLQIVGEDKPQ